jgi:FlaA1/EpsC-like NDP-sugar epimerase
MSFAMELNRLKLLAAYAAALAGSLWLAYQVRFNFDVPPGTDQTLLLVFAWVVSFKLVCLWRGGATDAFLGTFSLPDFSRLAWITLFMGFVLFCVSTWFGSNFAPPRGVVVADFSFSLLGLTAVRLAFRRAISQANARSGPPPQRARRAGIIGAGMVGTALAQEFAMRRDLGLQAVAFFDDDRIKWGRHIHNVPVVGAPELLESDGTDLELEEIIIAIPNATARRLSEIVKLLERLRIKFRTVPSSYELTTGKATVSQLRPVNTTDLLGREPVCLATEDIRDLLQDRTVMVTGAGGSIGSELCRQIASYLPRKLLLVEQSEVQLFQIEQELIESGWRDQLVPLAANVQDEARLESIFRQYQPAAVFHAAAHKHVPLMESQPGEAIKNNAVGTLRLAQMCLRHGTEQFVLISTDKAINPTSVMGATKRLAEMCIQSLQAQHPRGTRFMAVRFGNVLGSSGSVVPIFNKQIAAGGPVRVTHPDMKRFFMTIPEAVGLVLQSATLGKGGEIFMLDMGQPVKIVDLARQLIRLSGFVPDQDIRVEFTGIRPGEKLFEELSYNNEKVTATPHPKIARLVCEPPQFEKLHGFLLDLSQWADELLADELKHYLRSAIPEYEPQAPAIAIQASRRDAATRINVTAKRNGESSGLNARLENATHRPSESASPQ